MFVAGREVVLVASCSSIDCGSRWCSLVLIDLLDRHRSCLPSHIIVSCVDSSPGLHRVTQSLATGPAFASSIHFDSILSSCAFPDRLFCALREGRQCAVGDHACMQPPVHHYKQPSPSYRRPTSRVLLDRWSQIRYRQADGPGRGYEFPWSKAGACMRASGDVSGRWCSVGYLHGCL